MWKEVWSAELKCVCVCVCVCVEMGVVSSVKVCVWKWVWSAELKCVCGNGCGQQS